MFYAFIFLLFLFLICFYYCIKFAILLINTRDAIEESLDVIDEKYSDISRVLDVPIFSDSYEVKSVLKRLEEARNSLLYIANTLSQKNIAQEEEDIEYYDRKKD